MVGCAASVQGPRCSTTYFRCGAAREPAPSWHVAHSHLTELPSYLTPTSAALPLVGRWGPRSGCHVDLTTHLREGGRLSSPACSVDNNTSTCSTNLARAFRLIIPLVTLDHVCIFGHQRRSERNISSALGSRDRPAENARSSRRGPHVLCAHLAPWRRCGRAGAVPDAASSEAGDDVPCLC